jgi:hypothetical protein
MSPRKGTTLRTVYFAYPHAAKAADLNDLTVERRIRSEGDRTWHRVANNAASFSFAASNVPVPDTVSDLEHGLGRSHQPD